MSEPKPPSKQSLIFLIIIIGLCCCVSLIIGGLYLFWKNQKESTVNMEGTWLNRDSKDLEMNITDDGGDYITVKNADKNLDVTLKVSGRNPLKATYTKEVPISQGQGIEPENQEPVRTHIKTTYTLKSDDGKTATINTSIYDYYGNGERSADDTFNITIKLIKQGETEEEFRHVSYCHNRQNRQIQQNHQIQRQPRTQPRTQPQIRRRTCNCLNHKFSPYPNMW